MLDGLLKSKFYTKCKSAIKRTRTRIEMIKRKSIAQQKYLKNVITDLLKSGFDSNAFSRAEELLVEMNLSSCYDFLDQCCASISSHLSSMNKQSECPKECRESVSSLMFAAARFSDLPELRELRSLFAKRYGNALDHYINNEFVNKIKSTPPSKESKLLLMQDIAVEFGIEWNSKALEQKLFTPPPSNLLKSTKDDSRKNPKINKEPDNRKLDNKGIETMQNAVKDYKVKERIQEDLKSRGTKLFTHNAHALENEREIAEHKVHKSTAVQSIQSDRNRQQINQESSRSSSKNKVSEKKQVLYRAVPPPPPYEIKSKVTTTETDSVGHPEQKHKPKSSRSSSKNEVSEKKQVIYRAVPPPPYQIKPKVNTTETDSVGPPEQKPIPKSVRTTRLKPTPCQENVQFAKQALRILNEDHRVEKKHSEERVMNKLLLHYSAKQSPTESIKVESTDVYRNKGILQSRQSSLPTEPTSPIESTNGYVRSSSFEPEILNQFGHVHPNLPDYDDFVARLAELRGK